MTDEQEIANLVFLYAERIDSGDFEAVAELFSEAEITSEGTPLRVRGAAAVLGLYRATTRIHADTGTPRTAHVTTNLAIQVAPDRSVATCRSRFTVFQQTPRLAFQPIVAGRYRDAFARSASGWRFASRHMLIDLLGDVSEHLLISPASLASQSDKGAT